MATSLTSPGLRVAANQMLLSMHKDVSKVSMFTTNFTPDAAQKGSSLLIPIAKDGAATEFNRTSNNYGDFQGTIKYIPMKFAKHIKHSFGFTENDFNLVNGTSFWETTGVKSAEAVGRALADMVCGLINRKEIPVSGEDKTEFYDETKEEFVTGSGEKFSAANEFVMSGDITKKQVAGLRVACQKADISVRDTILALNPVKFAELLSILDANMYGGTEAIRDGLIPNLYGYKAIMELNELSTDPDEKLIGALIPASAIAIGSRTLEIQHTKLYDEVGTATDDKSGLTIQFRRGGDWKTGDCVATCEALFGAKLIQPTKIVRLVSAATTPYVDPEAEGDAS